MGRAIAWHLKQYAYLVQKFHYTPEGNGNMLDNSVLLYVSEGGHGYDPSSSSQNSPHSTENMAMFVAGRVGGLKPGLHFPTAALHPGQVLLSALKAVGYSQSAFGEVAGEIPGLRV